MIKQNFRVASHSGIFPYLVNSAAFVDRIELSVGENERKNPAPLISRRLRRGSIESKAIGGKNSLYARQLQGRSKYSGNILAVKYGKRKTYARVPSFRVLMRSDRVPLTAAQALFATQNLGRLHVSLIEMTFDLAGISIDQVSCQLFTRAGTRDYCGTMYVGSQHSDWQVRIYNKTDSIVRFEFILRRGVLQKYGIHQPTELIKLRTLNIWDLISFQQLKKNALGEVLEHIPCVRPGWTDILSRVADSYPQLAERILRTQCRVSTQNVFAPSPTQRLLQRMQRQFLW